MGAKTRFGFIHGKVGNAVSEFEQPLTRVAVVPVLFDRVRHGLLGEIVLEFEGDDRETVDEEHDVQRPLCFVAAVPKLPGNGETVLCKTFLRLFIVGRWGTVEQSEVVGTVPDTVSQHINGAPFRDFPLQPGEELALCRANSTQCQ